MQNSEKPADSRWFQLVLIGVLSMVFAEAFSGSSIESEYERCLRTLNKTGILSLLPHTESVGVIGIDGKEYPVPTQEQLQEVFTRNRELVDRKMRQGFTQLQLTPIAMPTSQLIDRAKTAVFKHAAAGKIIQTKQNSTALIYRFV